MVSAGPSVTTRFRLSLQTTSDLIELLEYGFIRCVSFSIGTPQRFSPTSVITRVRFIRLLSCQLACRIFSGKLLKFLHPEIVGAFGVLHFCLRPQADIFR